MEEMTFEQCLSKLEEIVKKMEKGDASLDESVLLYEEGTRLASLCDKLLDDAEQRVTKLGRNAEGDVEEIPFDAE